MYEINLSSSKSIIELVSVALIPVLLWAIYKVEKWREMKQIDRQIIDSDRIIVWCVESAIMFLLLHLEHSAKKKKTEKKKAKKRW